MNYLLRETIARRRIKTSILLVILEKNLITNQRASATSVANSAIGQRNTRVRIKTNDYLSK
jgi:hypothetical protein